MEKHSLPDIRTLFNNPPSIENWKKMMQTSVRSFWYNSWTTDQKIKSMLKHIKLQRNPHREPHNIWKSVYPQIQNIRRTKIKSRLITTIHTLQENVAKHYNN